MDDRIVNARITGNAFGRLAALALQPAIRQVRLVNERATQGGLDSWTGEPPVKGQANRQPNAQADHRAKGVKERQVVRTNTETNNMTQYDSYSESSTSGDASSVSACPHT